MLEAIEGVRSRFARYPTLCDETAKDGAQSFGDDKQKVKNRIGDNRGVKILTLAVTGASGSVYAVEMLRMLAAEERVEHVDLVVSESALRVLAEEMGISGRTQVVEKMLGAACAKVQVHGHNDIGANIASGSYPSEGMIVLPCSMGTLAGISAGLAANLTQRAADVCLKERRPLILCVRETPLNRIHLRNMSLAAEAGATIFPAIPTLYNKPQDTTEMARNFVQRVLGFAGLAQDGAYRWGLEE
jgi:4-hydroxy-3-polyprenylbenzoate decarboxylase